MTKIDYLISDTIISQTKNILLYTKFIDKLKVYYNEHNIYTDIDLFRRYDIVIMDQSTLDRVPNIYFRFLSQIIIIDDKIFNLDEQQNIDNIQKLYNEYNKLYNCIFITTNLEMYNKFNNLYNYFIDINDQATWRQII